jgi:hypothetical protein
MAVMVHPASPKQEAFILSLLAKREVPDTYAADLRERVALGALDSATASQSITFLRAQPLRAAEAAKGRTGGLQVAEQGMYSGPDGTVYRVVKAASGRLYAKRFTGKGFVYAAGAIFSLTPSDRMTLDEVKEVGIRSGHCAVCGKELTDPQSVALGIGPVCAGRV